MKRLKKHSLLKNLPAAVLLLCLCAGTAAAQAGRIDFDALTNDTQKSSPDPERMSLVWWIPEEYWRVALSQDPTVTKSETEGFLATVRPYLIFAVADGRIGLSGNVTYKSEQVIRNSLQVIDARGTVYRPIAIEKVEPGTKAVLSMMKPTLTNMLGGLGENLHFVVFTARDAAGQRIADPLKEGAFSLKLGEDLFKWRLPLGSLLPPKSCPADGEQLNGAWKFCPWHGEKLATKPND